MRTRSCALQAQKDTKALHYEKARERGAVGFLAQGNKGIVETRTVDGKTILGEVKEAEG